MTSPFAYIVAGLAFGDEGKGTATDYLARYHGANLVVRYNGGPQAAHNVVLPDGRHHTFSQFGSAYFVDGVRTYLSRHMLIEPSALVAEAKVLQALNNDNPYNRLTVDEDCLVVTPFHKIVNQMREVARGRDLHGSCGRGVGEARGDSLRGRPSLYIRDLKNRVVTSQILRNIVQSKIEYVQHLFNVRHRMEDPRISNLIREFYEVERDISALAGFYRDFAERFVIGNTEMLQDQLKQSVTVFEGAQGVLLDETYGFAPHNTWTDTTFRNAHELLSGTGVRSQRIGVMRSIMTRHGAGPLPTESKEVAYEGDHNTTNAWQGNFRFGYLDLVLIDYAIRACGGVDSIFLTHLDKAKSFAAIRYDGTHGTEVQQLPFGLMSSDLQSSGNDISIEVGDSAGLVQKFLKVPIHYTSSGPTWQHKDALLRPRKAA